MTATPPVALLHSAILQSLMGVLGWLGTLAFAFSGALLGVNKQFDLFGVLSIPLWWPSSAAWRAIC